MYAAIIFTFTLLFLQGHVTCASAESPSGVVRIEDRAPSGLVTGMDGRAVASTVGSNQLRDLRAGDVVRPGDELRVGAGSMIEVLWNRRALFSLGDQTVVRLLDGKGGQTPVQILEGNVRIAYSYNEGHPTDTLTVLTPEARTVMRGGILEALVGSEIQTNDRRLTTFGRTEEGVREAGRGDVIRIVEGQASVEPVSTGTKPVLLKAGHETRIFAAGSDIPRQYNGEHRQRLAAIAVHQEVPQLTVQRIAGIHVEHALELEQGLRKNAEDVKNAQSSDSRLKGAILSTSLGILVTPLQASNGSLTTAAVPVTTSVSVTPTTGVGSGSVSIPLTAPAPIPSTNTFVPSQAGGNNSLSLLREALTDALDRPGRRRGRGRDRD
ncbi:MAG: hypothetical protein ABW047_09080 [Nitrospiraceae bacterium]